MSLVSKIFGMLDAELAQHLVFSLTLRENLSRPMSRVIECDDRFAFEVQIRNSSSLLLKNVRGVISESPLARFRPVAFELPELRPREVRTLAHIEASAIRRPTDGALLDNVGHVTVSATADLSELQYQEWGKPIVHAGRPPMRVGGDRRSLPLSHLIGSRGRRV